LFSPAGSGLTRELYAQAVTQDEGNRLRKAGLGTHLLTVGMSGGKGDAVVIDGRPRKIWTVEKYIDDGAVGSLVNSNYAPCASDKPAINAHYVHLKVPKGRTYRFPYSSSPAIPEVSVVQATRTIRKGDQILVDYGHSYNAAYLDALDGSESSS